MRNGLLLSGVNAVRFASSVNISQWKIVDSKAVQLLAEAGLKTVSRDEFLNGEGDALLLFKWGLCENEQAIAQLQLIMDLQVPNRDEHHQSIVWLSQSLCVLDLSKTGDVEKILLNEIREFIGAWQTARSLPF